MCDKKVYVILVIPQQTSRAGRNTKSGFSKQLSAITFTYEWFTCSETSRMFCYSNIMNTNIG